jgi:hypothetical protein
MPDNFWCKASRVRRDKHYPLCAPSLKAICGLTSLLKVKLDPPPLTVKEATQYRLLIDRARRPAEISVLTRYPHVPPAGERAEINGDG